MADAAAKPAAPAAPAAHAPEGGGGGGSSKVMLGVMALNMVMMAVVAVVLFLGQKKQASQETLDQVEQGAAAAGHGAPAAGGHGAPAAEHGGGGGEHGGGGGGHGEAAAPAEGARFFSVGDFIANLAGPASTHYVKVTVNFELDKEADDEEVKQRKPQFRDKVISLLNSKQPADLQSVEGRNALKEEIKTVSNTFLKKGKVEGVYFSAFVVN